MRTRPRTRTPETRKGPRLAPRGTARAIARAIAPDPGPPRPPGPLALRRPRKPPKKRSELRPKGGGTYRTDGVFVADVGEDGRVTIEDKRNFRFKTPLSGGFDLTDWAMRSSGQDPYSARKIAFMDRTRNERVSIAAKHKRDSLRSSVAELQKHLRRIWRFQRWPASRRRRVLFELWDECAEKGSQQVLAAAATARATIVAFIRRELPTGSAHSYTRAELDKLNARRTSKARFAPY